MMMIIQVPYSDIDRMTDTFIDKSSEFTITGDPIVLAMNLRAPFPLLRLKIPDNIKSGDVFNATTDFNLVIIPKDLSAEQIRSLSDVERLGGKLVATRFSTVQFTVTTKPAG
jgi:hypothetical protein